ncbi:MAG: lipid IV(A) 3-deoxy-D-manno-octulosonic acid transferase [Gammaproteobacteria bacterium]|nr:lipid IV(A) 3-deoxy-D-manno-octulosonic acid transferase [Gammaproteobacteria bacterium]
MRHTYTLLLYLLLPLVLLRLVWRGLRAPAYWRRWPERFGFVPLAPTANPVIWLHAVSVGEVQAAAPLVRALMARYPQHRVVLTTMTPTGAEQVRASFGQGVTHCYVPYDLPGAVRRFLVRVRPSIAIIMETELWPNIFHGCHERAIPLLLVNVRLSARSAAGYRRVRSLTAEMLGCVSAIAAQTQKDAARIIALGAEAARVRVTGSIKFDINMPASLHEEAAVLRRSLGAERAVWIAASTREGEETMILEAYASVRRSLPQSLLVLVPRHPERFARVAALCRRHGFNTVLRSEPRSCDASTEVFIGDSMGELALLYAAADVAFVGGSLVPAGGHNMIEPAALGLPVIFGPHVFNFEEASRLLREAGAAEQVRNVEQLATTVLSYLTDANLRHATGEKGRQLVQQNRGALDKVLGIAAGVIPAP